MEKRSLIFIILFTFLFILIRSLHFSEYLNFSYDQASASTKALEIWRNKEITLVGPGSSLVANGKQMLQGSINYYFQLLFLLLGNFDPVRSSYLFMLFCSLMIIPLYFGVKYLFSDKTAVFSLIFYSLAPLYVDFTRFFFGPNYQFSLITLLLLFAGLFVKTQKMIFYLLVFFLIGVVSQFHFATLVLLIFFLTYYLLNRKLREQGVVKLIFLALAAFLVGFSPIIVFELKNRFYNLTVLLEYLRIAKSAKNFQLLPHRYLSFSLILLVFVSGHFRKYLSHFLLIASFFILLTVDLFLYSRPPNQAFGMSPHWNYLLEKKAFEVIRRQKLKNYNIANLIYDNKSVVIKYLMKRENLSIDYDDYYKNKLLFVIDTGEAHLVKNPAYEIQTFYPRKKLRQWRLNSTYTLFLYERI